MLPLSSAFYTNIRASPCLTHIGREGRRAGTDLRAVLS